MYEFITEGMTCNNCVKHVTRALKQADPAADVQIDLAQQRVRVKSEQSQQLLERAMEDAGYPVRQATRN